MIVLSNKLKQLFKFLEERGFDDITKVKESDLMALTNDLYKGKIKRQDGKDYEAPGEFISGFKTFWHWWMKINRKNKNIKSNFLVNSAER